jgi:hypothetical protein
VSPPPRPHPLARAPLVERLNGWLEAAWRKGWARRPSLDPEVLWAKALRASPAEGEFGGRSEEDAADFRVRLERLCASLQDEAALNALGLTIAHGQLTRVVGQRLKLGALWRRRPGILAQSLAPPILVVGQMRGGTTRVHRLLAADPAHAATRFCDSWHPVPEAPDLRPLWSGLTLAFLHRVDPWLDSLHPFGSTRPDEELGWLAAALDHCAYEAQWRIPAFVAFSEARDPVPVYREFARILATDASHRGNAGRSRVMKVPQFAEDLGPLLAQFPDARVVVARRDPAEVLASSVSFVANQMTIQSDAVEMAWIEAEWYRKIGLRDARMGAALAAFSGPVTEISYAALDGDWEAEIGRAYRELDLQFTESARAAMRAEQGRRSAHARHQQAYRTFARA